MRSDYLLIKPLHQAISQVKKFVLLLSFSLIAWSSWAQAPTIQATNIVVTAKTQTSLTFNWTNGDGARRIVLVKTAISAFTPVNGESYSNNPDFSAVGNLDLDAGAPVVKSVFDGINGPVTVSGLVTGTSYIIQVYEFNVPVITPVYKTENGLTNNPITTSTITTEPGADPSGLAFSNVAGRSLTLSWNAIGTPANSGTERIVIVNVDAVSSIGPIDGTTYTANPIFGSGSETVASNSNYVVYKGTGTSVNITGLTANTNYKFSVVAFNGSGGSENYKGSGTQQNRITSPHISSVAFSTPAANTPIKIGTATVTITVDSDFGIAHTLQGGTVAGYALTGFTRSNNTTYTANITIANGGTDIPAGNDIPVANLVLRNSNSVDNPAYSQNIIQPNDPLDANRPTISIGAPSAVLVKNSSSATYTITYAGEDNITLANGNITINQGTGANATPDVTGAGSTRTVTLTNFTGNGTVGISIAAGTGADAAGNLTLAAGPSATIAVDTQAPTNQNTVFAASIGALPGGTVTIVTSGTASNEVWFAPTGTTTFLAGATMTKAVSGTATSILAPATAGDYKLFVLDAIGNISNESTATLAVFSPQATNLTFSAASTDAADQINFNWTNGGGDGRIVIMKTQGAVYNLPAGALTADLDFTNGTDLNGGSTGTVRCVFIGTGSGPIEVFGLSGATTYTIEVYEYKGANIYLKPALSADRSTINGTSPTDPAAAMAFTNITNNSITVQFTQSAGSSGTASMLVARAGAAVSFTPVNGVSYSADPDYSLGNDLGSGNKVIAQRLDANAGTAIIISGLNPDVVYHFAVVNFNGTAGTGAENYGTLVADVLLGNRNTEPSTLSSGFTFTPGETSLTLDWTGNNGNGDGRVVVMRSGLAVATDPVDYTNYTANNNFGFGAPPTASAISAGYLVYDGTGSTVTINNLFPSTTYHFAVYEYNNTTSQGTPNKVYGAGAATSQATTADVTAPVPPNPVGSLTTVGGTVVAGYWNSTNTQLQVVVPLPTNDGSLDGGSVQIRLMMTGGALANIPGSGVSTITNGQRVAGTKTVTINAADLENVATGFTEGNVSGASGSETKFLIIGARISDLAGNPSVDYTQSATQLDVDQTPPTQSLLVIDERDNSRERIYLKLSELSSLADDATVTGITIVDAQSSTTLLQYQTPGNYTDNSSTITLPALPFIVMASSNDGEWDVNTGVTYTAGGNVRDIAGNELVGFINVKPGDTTAPTISSGLVFNPNGPSNKETISFRISEALNLGNGASVVGFGFSQASPGATAIYTSASRVVTLTSGADGDWNDNVTISYTQSLVVPVSNVIDINGNQMANFAGEPILLKSINITSNNSINPSTHAKQGAEITLTFTTSRALASNPAVTLGTVVSVAQPATFFSLVGSVYTYKYTTTGSTDEGLLPFSITADETGPPPKQTIATFTTNGSSITFDKTLPTQPSLPDLLTADDTGPAIGADTDNYTKTNTGLDFSGATDAGSTVRIYNGATLIGVIPNAPAAWAITTYTPGNPDSPGTLADGVDYPITVTATDAAGNVSLTSPTLLLTIDNTPPNVVSIFRVTSPLNGWSTTGGTSANSVIFRITFDEPVSGLDYNFGGGNGGGQSNFRRRSTGDVNISAYGGPAGTSNFFDVTVSGISGTGTLSLDFLDKDNVLNKVGDPVGGLGLGNGDFNTDFIPLNEYYTIVLPQPATATAINHSALTPTSVTLGWSHPTIGQQPTHYLILAKENHIPSFTIPTDGNLPVVDSDPLDGNGILAKVVASTKFPNLPVLVQSTPLILKSGVTYDFAVVPYTLSVNNTDDNIDYGTSTEYNNFVTTPTATETTLTTLTSGSSTINSLVDTQAEEVNALSFRIKDDGAGGFDNAPFKFRYIKILRGAGAGTITDWTQALAGARLTTTAGGTKVGSITADSITFSAGISDDNTDFGFISDEGFKDYTLVVWLKSDLDGGLNLPTNIDGLNFIFQVAPAGFTLENTTNNNQASSQLSTTTFAASTAGNNKVDVVATKLVYATPGTPGAATNPQPQIGVGTNFGASSAAKPTIYALDGNNNLDKDYNATFAVTPSTGVVNSHTNFSAGVLTLLNFNFSTAGTRTITISGNSVATPIAYPAITGGNAALSTSVNAVISNLTTITDGPTLPGAEQASFSSLTNTLPASFNFDFTITDDAGASTTDYANNDGLPTLIQTITIAQSADNGAVGVDAFDNWVNSIGGAQLSDGSSSVTINPGASITASTLVFNVLGTTLGTVAELTPKTYQLRIWLKFSVAIGLRDILDNKDFAFSINQGNITIDPANANATSIMTTGSTSTNNDRNIVRVTATQLDFTTQPANSQYDADFTAPFPKVKARDVNGNLDVGYTGTPVVTVQPNIPKTYPIKVGTETLINTAGIVTFDSVGVGVGAKFTITSGGLGTSGDQTRLEVSGGLNDQGLPVTKAISNLFTLTYSGFSDIERDAFTHPTNIVSINNRALDITAGNSIALDQFLLRDGGSSNDTDGSKTKLASISLNVTNHHNIQRIGLYDENNVEIKELGSADFSTGGDITFTAFANPFEADDNDRTTKKLTVRVSFKDDVSDNEQINVSVTAATAGGVGSQLIPISIGGANLGTDKNKIEVVATKIDFTTIPATASVSVPFAVQVSARDIYGNLDEDYNGTISAVSNTIPGGFNTINPPSGAFAGGLKSYPATFQFDLGNGDVKLTIGSGIGSTAGSVHSATVPLLGTSPTISVISSFDSRIAPDPTFTHSADVNYINHQATDINLTNTSFEITRFILHDGDPAMPYPGAKKDLDGAPTILENLDVELFTGASRLPIRRIAIYADGVEKAASDKVPTALASGKSTTSFDFVGVNKIEVPDEGQAVISIRVSFLNNAADILDNDPITVRISGATNLPGSKFITTSGFIAGVNGGLQTPAGVNKVEVTATKLDFTTQPGIFAGINEPIANAIVEARDQFGLRDLDFIAPAVLSATSAGISNPNAFTFASGVLTLTGMQYSSAGDGTFVVNAGGILSNVNNTVDGLSNVAVQCAHVDVINVLASLATGGTTSSTNLPGSSINKVIFGVTFSVPYRIGTDPRLNKFTINFSNSITGVFKNIRIFESTSVTYSSGTVTNVATPNAGGGNAKLTVGPQGKSLLVDFTQTTSIPNGIPRNLTNGAGGNPSLTYFMMVDVDATANSSTPSIQPRVEDLGFSDPFTNSNIVITQGSTYSATAVGAAPVGKSFTFSSTFAPTLLSSFPAKGDLNIALNQPAISLVFSVPVWTMNSKISLYEKTSPSATGTFVADLPAVNGIYSGGNLANLAGSPTTPLKFSLTGVTLLPDHLYYVTIAAGVFNGASASGNLGLMDEELNLFPGISSPGTLYFKTSSNVPPNLLSASPATPPSIKNITLAGATVNATFDQTGTAYFMVVNQGGAAPSNAQIKSGAYPSGVQTGTYIFHDSFVINQTNTISQLGIITAALSANTNYDVYMYAESYSSLDGVLTAIPTSAPYGNAASNFVVNGGGATLAFRTPATQGVTGPYIDPGTLSVTIVSLCDNSSQILNAPIVIVEGGIGDFNANGSGVQTLNLLLPTGFQFDVTRDGSNKPVYGKLILAGLDFDQASGNLDFINSSILSISYKNTNNLSFDNILISGLKVIASSGASGNITRLGGNALTSFIADFSTVFVLGSYSPDLELINFTNSYSQINFPTNAEPVTVIPDNHNAPTFSVQLVPLPLSGDYGPSTFSGTGVNLDQLSLTATTLGSQFNITMTHTDNNGCVSVESIPYLVYDHTKAIGGLATEYCILNNTFPYSWTAQPVDSIKYNNITTGYVLSMTADIPSSATAIGFGAVTDQQMTGPAWRKVVQSLPVKGFGHLSDNVISTPNPGEFYYDYAIDATVLLNAKAIATANSLTLPDPYFYFLSNQTPQRHFFYTGGSLGVVEYTSTYQSIANSLLQFPLKQNVEYFVPAIPIIEVDQANQISLDINDPLNPPFVASAPPLPDVRSINNGTPIFCPDGGVINISGYPLAVQGISTGSFTLFDAQSSTPIVTSAFVDNGNGTAVLDPLVFQNNFKNIKIVYTYKLDLAPNNANCTSSGSRIIRITPKPVAIFANSPYTCVGSVIDFTDASTIVENVPGENRIERFDWDFGDQAGASGGNRNIYVGRPFAVIKPTPKNPTDTTRNIPYGHIYGNATTYPVGLTVTSKWGCVSAQTINNLIVGSIPTPQFSMVGVSAGKVMGFVSTSKPKPIGDLSSNSQVDSLFWSFGDAVPDAITKQKVPIITHTYSNAGKYVATLVVKTKITNSTSSCLNTISRQIIVVPTVSAAAVGTQVTDDFESPDPLKQWQTSIDSVATIPSSWERGVATKANITTSTNTWVTGKAAGSTYKAGEVSYLYSPAYDISNLLRPMISFDQIAFMGANDGVALDFSVDNLNVADTKKKWYRIGTNTDGTNWYDKPGLASKPGSQLKFGDVASSGDFGWTRQNAKAFQSKHTLSPDVPADPIGRSRIVFRFALASVAGSSEPGFALDNFRIGERTRIVLLESFANAGNPAAEEKTQNDAVALFNAGSVGTDVIKLNYHTSFPGSDPFNQDNPADPSSRALYYEIAKTPTSVLDGLDSTAAWTQWGPNKFNTQTLELAGAEINIAPPVIDAAKGISVSISVDAISSPIPKDKTILFVAVVEQSVAKAVLNATKANMIKSNETNFEYVVKKLLPSAAGTKLTTDIVKGTPQTFNFEWAPDLSKFYAPNTGNLAIVAFLQDELTRKVYQTKMVANLNDPPVITGIEMLLPEQINVYPNPANKEFIVELPGIVQNDISLRMVDQVGRMHESGVITSGKNSASINVEQLAEGIYILVIGSDKTGVVRKKVMVVRKN